MPRTQPLPGRILIFFGGASTGKSQTAKELHKVVFHLRHRSGKHPRRVLQQQVYKQSWPARQSLQDARDSRDGKRTGRCSGCTPRDFEGAVSLTLFQNCGMPAAHASSME